MSSYILAMANRYYSQVEDVFGQAAGVGAADRLVASHLDAMQVSAVSARRDKSGSRTRVVPDTTGRRATGFTVRTYMTSNDSSGIPSFGKLLQSALGATPRSSGSEVVAAVSGTTLKTAQAHGLGVGCGIAAGKDIRFVAAVVDSTTVTLNAPFTTPPQAGGTLLASRTYGLNVQLPSVSIYDYWQTAGAVSRVLTGSVVNTAEFSLTGGMQEFSFSGLASNLVDSATFTAGEAGLTSFPVEPQATTFNYSPVPITLGQVWLGSPEAQVFTLIDVAVHINNHLQARGGEFGSRDAFAFVPGRREVRVDFSLLTQTDEQSNGLYALARRRGTMGALLQFGQSEGQMMAIHLPSVTPELPVSDDSGQRLIWRFKNNRAEGGAEDELSMAFA